MKRSASTNANIGAVPANMLTHPTEQRKLKMAEEVGKLLKTERLAEMVQASSQVLALKLDAHASEVV